MEITRLAIPDVLLLKPVKHGDDRGFFSEVFRDDALRAFGLDVLFVQDNHAFSSQAGVLRGLHFQSPPSEQGKLVRCTRGAILDVAVDIRHGSPTFGQHVVAELTADNWTQIWAPPGFAHGYITLVADCEVLYKVTGYYDPSHDHGVAWDDPDLAIDWPLERKRIILSAKDGRHPRLADSPTYFTYTG